MFLVWSLFAQNIEQIRIFWILHYTYFTITSIYFNLDFFSSILLSFYAEFVKYCMYTCPPLRIWWWLMNKVIFIIQQAKVWPLLKTRWQITVVMCCVHHGWIFYNKDIDCIITLDIYKISQKLDFGTNLLQG